MPEVRSPATFAATRSASGIGVAASLTLTFTAAATRRAVARLRIGAALPLLHRVGFVIGADVQPLLVQPQLLGIDVAGRLDRVAIATTARRAGNLAACALLHGALLIRLGALRFLGHGVSVGNEWDRSKRYALPMRIRRGRFRDSARTSAARLRRSSMLRLLARGLGRAAARRAWLMRVPPLLPAG